MDNFTEPLMEDAIEKRNLDLSTKGADAKDDDEHGNLLAHLVKHTQGTQIQFNFIFFDCLMCLGRPLDKNILKDEVI